MAPFLWACLSKYCQPHPSLKGVQPLLPVRPHPICELLGAIKTGFSERAVTEREMQPWNLSTEDPKVLYSFQTSD